MSSITSVEKLYFERLFDLESGTVLNCTTDTYDGFFKQNNVDIDEFFYVTHTDIQVRQLRDFWNHYPDDVVGKVLSDMLDYYEHSCRLDKRDVDENSLQRARTYVARMTGEKTDMNLETTRSVVLEIELDVQDIRCLPIEERLVPIVEARLNEARAVLNVKAYLSATILLGTVLEAILLGFAHKYPAKFNQARATPCSNGSPKAFRKWTLAQLIDVAFEVDVIKPDIKDFSHVLRTLRNYVHPHEQLSSGFTPDEHTASVCIQVLKAMLASVAAERG